MEQGGHFCRCDMAVAVVEAANQSLRLFALPEIDNQQTPAAFENSPYLVQTALPDLARQVVKHQRAQHDIHLGVMKGKPFDACIPEIDS